MRDVKSAPVIHFNSSMVRLGVADAAQPVNALVHFNSSMVRLGDPANDKRYYCKRISIPVWYDWGIILYPRQRSRYGISIPVWYDWGFETKDMDKIRKFNFNSSMVRLGASTPIMLLPTPKYFNSSMVRLGDRTGRTPHSGHVDFNSSMVRLGG